MEAIAFAKEPLSLTGEQLSISLEKLNEGLEPYGIRVDAITDIYVDKEASASSSGDVLKIHAVYINPNSDFDEELFFKGYLEMEDKFEALSSVYSAEFDSADLVMTLILNARNVKVNATLEQGGAVDPSIEAKVDTQLRENTKEIFDLVGIEIPASDADMTAKLPQVRQRAIEHYRKLQPQPLYVFYGGIKMDIAPGAGMNVLPLQTELARKLYDVMGKKLNAPDHQVQNLYANNKAILAIDMLKGMASQHTEPVFHITDALLDEVVERVQEERTH